VTIECCGTHDQLHLLLLHKPQVLLLMLQWERCSSNRTSDAVHGARSTQHVIKVQSSAFTKSQHRLSVQAAIISLRAARADKSQIKPQTADNLPILVR
jgi:hypothetical protein